jgi:hypothetical protein
MGKWAGMFLTWLVSISTPIFKRALIAIGLGTVTYTGVDAVFSAAQNAVLNNYGQMPAAAAQIASMAGVPECIGILLGALSSRLAISTMTRFAKVT